jgi:hypothetical protein
MISALLGDRPAGDAPARARADWFGRKADVFARIAAVNAADGDLVRAAEARVQAAEARTQAQRLQTEAAAEKWVCLTDEGDADDEGDRRALVTSGQPVAFDDGDGLP